MLVIFAPSLFLSGCQQIDSHITLNSPLLSFQTLRALSISRTSPLCKHEEFTSLTLRQMTIPLQENINSYIMGVMRHRTVLILIGLLLVGVAAYFYIENIFLPVQFKQFMTTNAEKLLQRRVSVDTIDFRPIRGFVIRNIFVSRKDDPSLPFIQIDEVTFNLLLAPVFRKKTVILPNIKIKNPYVYLSRSQDGTWNFSDLTALGRNMDNKNSFSVLLRKLRLENGKVHCLDKTQDQEFFESFENININTTLSLNKGVRFIVQAQVPRSKTAMVIKGNYSLLPRKLTAQVLLDNVFLARYLPLFRAPPAYVGLTDGVLSSGDFGVVYEDRRLLVRGSFFADDTAINVGENKQMSGSVHVPTMALAWQDYKWNAKGLAMLPSVRMTSSDGKEFQGDIKADLNLLTLFENHMTAQGNVTVDNARFADGDGQRFAGNITAANASLVKGDGTVRLHGNFDIKETTIVLDGQTSLEGDLSTSNTDLLWSRDDSGTNKFLMQSGFKMDNAQAALGKDRSGSSHLDVRKASVFFDRTKLTVEALGRLGAADIFLTKDNRFKGSPEFDIFFERVFERETPVDYKATFRFVEGLFTGIPYLGTIENVHGTVAVMPDIIQTDRLMIDTHEARIELSGLLSNFSKPALKAKASSEHIDLETVIALFPALGKKIRADVTGHARVHANYDGPAFSPSGAVIRFSAQLAEATLTHEKLPEAFTDISGWLNYENDLIKWHDLRASYKNRPYTFNGRLNNFSRPLIDTEVTGDQLRLSAQVKILHSALQLTSFVGQYRNSAFDFKGDGHLFDNAPADFDLRGKFSLDLDDAAVLVPGLKHRFDQINPTGIVAGEGIYKGKVDDWRNWQLALTLASDKITLNGFPFENVAVRVTQRDLTVSKCNITSKIYGGDLIATSSADLRKPEIPFSAVIDLKNLDFVQYRKDKNPKNRQLAGILTLTTSLEGKIDQWRELTGKGSLKITNGHLWQWDILDGMSKALLIPEFKNFVFTEASGHFFVRDRKILTNDARMTGKSVTLDGKGWIDFDRNIDFDIKPTFSKLAILQSDSMKKGTTSIVTQTDGYLNIKLTGTLDKPRHHVEKFPMKIIGGTISNTTGTIKEVIGGIVEEIF